MICSAAPYTRKQGHRHNPQSMICSAAPYTRKQGHSTGPKDHEPRLQKRSVRLKRT